MIRQRTNGKPFLGTLGLMVLSILWLGACAKERPVKHVIPDGFRISKDYFNGTFLYLSSVADVESPGSTYSWLPEGYYLTHDRLVRFEIKPDTLDIVAVDPQYQTARVARKNAILASFPIEHVDVLRKENKDGNPTHEEEVTKDRRVWSEREYIKIDVTEDPISPFHKDTLLTSPPENGLELDPETGALNFVVTRHLNDDTIVKVRYSLMPYRHNVNYEQREYPRELQQRFGFFKTTTYRVNPYGRIVEQDRKEFINRWDTSRNIVYYLSPDFPEALIPSVRQVFANWNRAFREATGRNVLELRENTGQQPGDIRYSMVTYVDAESASHGILGYGPSYTNPRTGEIIKGDVYLYGGTLKSSVFSGRIWEALLREQKNVSAHGTVGHRHPHEGDGIEFQRESLVPGPLVDLFASLRTPGGVWNAPKLSTRLDNEALEYVRTLRPQEAIERIRGEMLKDLNRRITRVNEDMLAEINTAAHLEELSDEELQKRIFVPLLTHELGHTFGLRHNFLGSADEKHFAPESRTSSVMDYGYLTSHEPMSVAPYDAAAIKVAYGDGSERTIQPLIAENYYYCTDEHTMDSRNAMCNQFDAGTDLRQVVASWLNRYKASYLFNNLRLDRVHFGGSSVAYANRIQRYLIPIRLAFDNANAIMRAGRTALQSGDLANLWYVARQRIEADAKTPAEDVITIRVSAGVGVDIQPGEIAFGNRMVERRIDRRKIAAVFQDAVQAQTQAFMALAAIVLDEERPLFSTQDYVHGELQVRGVILDKLLSVLYVGSRTSDPLGEGSTVSMFSSLENGAAETFFQSLISNTQPARDQRSGEIYRALNPYDVNLRELALNILLYQLAVPGTGAEAREMLALEEVDVDMESLRRQEELMEVVAGARLLRPQLQQRREELEKSIVRKELVAAGLTPFPLLSLVPSLLTIPDHMQANEIEQLSAAFDTAEAELKQLQSRPRSREDQQVERILGYRNSIRQRYRRIFAGTLPADDQQKVLQEIRELEKEREEINTAFVSVVGSRHLKAQVKLDGYTFTTATGHLIRDNINRMEDRKAAVDDVMRVLTAAIERESAKPEGARDEKLIDQLSSRVSTLSRMSDAMHDYLASERLFLKKLYRVYTDPTL